MAHADDSEQYTHNVACLEACSRLFRYGVVLIDNWQARGGRSYNIDADVLMLSLHARSTRTFQGTLRVSQYGLAEQATMLTRSLYEDMVDAHWISRNRDDAVQLFADHRRYSLDHKAAIVERYPEHFDHWDVELPRLTDDGRTRLRPVFGKHCSTSWTGLSLPRRVNEILPCWKPGADRRQVMFIFEWVLPHVNETLHTSSASISAMIEETGDPSAPLAFEIGASDESLPRVLFFAYWSYWQMLSLIMDEFGLSGLDDLRGLVERDSPSFGSPR